MRNGLALLALVTIAGGASAAERDRGPGLSAQRQGTALVYQARDFDAVSLGGGATVLVTAGPAWSIRAEGPPAAFADFRIARDGRRLEIGRRYQGRSGDLDRRITVRVTMPALSAANVGGSGSLHADNATGPRFTGAVGGSGRLRIDRIAARTTDLSVGGSGSIVAAGTTDDLTVSVGGSGDVSAPDLHAAHADVSLGGSGRVVATVDGPASVSIAGSGSVDLGRRARCRISRVGSGRARCGG